MIVFDDTKSWEEKLALYRHTVNLTNNLPSLEKADVEYVSVPQSEPLKNECQYFVDLISERVAPRTDGSEGMRVLKVLTALSSSQIEGTAVEVHD